MEQQLVQQIKELRKEQSKISMMDNFAVHAKIQRRINKIEMDLSNISDERTTNKLTLQLAIRLGSRVMIALCMLFIILFYKNTPVYVFPNNFNFFPLNNLISYPNVEPGSVSVHAWLMVTNCVARQIVK